MCTVQNRWSIMVVIHLIVVDGLQPWYDGLQYVNFHLVIYRTPQDFFGSPGLLPGVTAVSHFLLNLESAQLLRSSKSFSDASWSIGILRYPTKSGVKCGKKNTNKPGYHGYHPNVHFVTTLWKWLHNPNSSQFYSWFVVLSILKNMSSSMGRILQYINGKIKVMFETTNQIDLW